ncbi:autotransporter domain-containing protein [Pseudomonas sp. PD9R]|uniref:autotransporter outer membrane beta-barrel domain-containing protein n=1 Tax=Pseudomonas sp. PD9R TaxID=2853534 RepID=UPI001C468A6B|nr:autotransporter outer membrane beta-barrel domain-containing protein [Pseudomonas sp. PD9R]MBV6825357.1 autotransporter domain-containing protein [Pseudomonas sp. PD9R]
MPTQHKFRPKHLALAVALSVGCVETSVAQQLVIESVTDEKITKPRKKTPKPAAPIDDLFALKEFIGPLKHTTPTNTRPREEQTTQLPLTQRTSAPVEFDDTFYDLLDFPEPSTIEMAIVPAEENPFDNFQNAYTTQHTIISKPLENTDGIALQLGEADDLLVINKGAQWDGRIDGGSGKNGLLLNAFEGGEIGETKNFEGLRIARGQWALHHDFDGHAEIKAGGSLLNNGSIKGDAYVDANAVYAGYGSVNDLYVDGSLEVNTALGSPIINGNLTLDKEAAFSYGVTADKLPTPVLVEGIATLAGAKFHVFGVTGDYPDSTVHPVLFAGKIEGEFGQPSSNLAFMTPTLSYSNTTVTLTYERNALKIAELARTPSGQALARSVDASETASESLAIRSLLYSNKSTAPVAIEQLAASNNANLAKATLSSVSPVSTSMLSAMRQLDNRRGPLTESSQAPRLAIGNQQTGRVWLQALGNGGKVDRGFNTSLNFATHGILLGADWRHDDHWQAGVTGGKSQTRLDAGQYDGDLDSWHFGAYAVRQEGPFALRLGAVYSSHDGSSKRQVAFNRFSDRPKSRYDASTQQAFAEAGYNLGRGNISFEPFASLGYQRYQRDTFTEKGGAAALKVHGQTNENISSTFGLRLAQIHALDNGMQLTPRFSAGWKYTYGELDSYTRQRLVTGGRDYTVSGAPLDRESLMLDAGLDLRVSANNSLGVGFTGEAGDDGRSYGVMGQWQLAF